MKTVKKYVIAGLAIMALSAGPVAGGAKYDIVVAKTGGDFAAVQAAIDAAPEHAADPVRILIEPGTYKEKIVIPASKTNLHFFGKNKKKTVITYDDYSGKGDINTFTSYTAKVEGDGFRAENLTFENSAGRVGQAVALHIEADRCVVVNCIIKGNQDTLFASAKKGTAGRQYFKNCYIEGTTDFIFGAATAVFENCRIHSKKNSHVTAASTPQEQEFGYVFIKCRLTADPGLENVTLGRPWRDYAAVAYIQCHIGDHIIPEGWNNWRKPEREKTARYAEYKSSGPGANPAGRASWSRQLTDEEAARYTVEKALAGADNWQPR